MIHQAPPHPLPIDSKVHRIELTRGQMCLQINRQSRDLEDLLLLAERENPKRAFLFVSRVLGRHIPVSPQAHRDILRQLADLAFPHVIPFGGALVMGYAETAVGLGAGVHDELRAYLGSDDLAYLPSTRHPGDRPVWFSFSEDHSHATCHHVLKPSASMGRAAHFAKTLVLVDDEVTTGKTFLNLIRAMFAAGRQFERIVLVTLTDWSDGKAAAAVAEAAGLSPDAVRAVSLVSGSYSWEPRADAPAPSLPQAVSPLAEGGIAPREGAWRAGIRGHTGMAEAASAALRALPARSMGPVLVIGTGEFVWHAFRLAEELAQRGRDTAFLATTRSPVTPGAAIRHKASFRDHYGLGVPMYLHNVEPSEWAGILMLVEGNPAGFIAPELAAYLGDFTAVSLDGTATTFKNGTLA